VGVPSAVGCAVAEALDVDSAVSLGDTLGVPEAVAHWDGTSLLDVSGVGDAESDAPPLALSRGDGEGGALRQDVSVADAVVRAEADA